MIFYFSGTGNSAWAARQLARLTGDTACDITTLKELPDMDSAKQLGFVFPVYAWGAPEVMGAFVKKLPRRQIFTFGVCTCGSDAGNCPAHAITLRESKPAWAAQCYQCMRCINECPQQAIQYGKATAGRRRYTIRAYLPQDEQ